MITFRQGEVIFVPFPFSDQTTAKQRPAVIVSSNEYNSSRADVIIAAITSVVRVIWIGDYRLRDWKEAGLVKPSVAKATLATIDKDMIKRKLGILTQTDLDGLSKSLIKVIEFKRV